MLTCPETKFSFFSHFYIHLYVDGLDVEVIFTKNVMK